jgi:hypothetical protein
MSRITGGTAFELVEAYNAVYAPQELTEEQIWEEVENWVNSLLEEGYDLSEYTWEEMYEAYLSEMGSPGGNLPGGTRPISNAPYQSRFARPMNANTPRSTGRGTSLSRPQIGSLPSSARQVTQYPQGVSTGVGGGNAAASRPAPRPAAAAPRPAAAAPKPAAAAPKPAATPTAKPAPTASTPTAPAAKPANSLMSNMPKVPSMAAPAGGPTLSARAQALKAGGPKGGGRERMLNQDLDLFDVIKGHLLDEGYADTEEAALAIMANMSEDWREEILNQLDEEQKPLPTKKMKARRMNVYMKTGEAAGSSRNERIRGVLDAHEKDPEGEAAKAKAKSKYKG